MSMRLKDLSLLLILITFSLLIWGGIVHNTESSLACPDWPTCYGTFFPKMEGGIFIEHGHRLLATLVGFLTTLLTLFTYYKFKKANEFQSVFHLSALSLIMVIAQGILGGITVVYKLPTIVSTTHLGLSMVFFCTLILLHHRLSLLDHSMPGKIPRANTFPDKEAFSKIWKPAYRHGILGMGCFLYIQILLGAFMRHSGAGASCGLGPQAWGMCLDTISWSKSWWPASHPAQLHMIHRYLAVLLGIGVLHHCTQQIVFSIKNKSILKGAAKPVIFWCVVGIVAIVAQIALGVMTVAMNLSIIPTTAHLAIASLCLASLFKINLILKTHEESFFLKGAHSLVSDIIELTKPNLSALVLSTAFVGILLAPGEMNFFQGLFSLFLIGMVVAGGCALNCYLEMDIDALMERTKVRSLPAERLNAKWALAFGIILLALAIPLLVLLVNPLTGALAALAALLYLFLYTPMKVKSPYAVIAGAIPGAIPPILGWTSVTGELNFDTWSLFLILFFWQIPHFLAISIFNAKDYEMAKIKVFPNILGNSKTRNSIIALTLVMLVVNLLPYYLGSASKAFVMASAGLSVLMVLLSLSGLRHSDNEVSLILWSKRYFWGTILYLPLLLGAMIFLK